MSRSFDDLRYVGTQASWRAVRLEDLVYCVASTVTSRWDRYLQETRLSCCKYHASSVNLLHVASLLHRHTEIGLPS